MPPWGARVARQTGQPAARTTQHLTQTYIPADLTGMPTGLGEVFVAEMSPLGAVLKNYNFVVLKLTQLMGIGAWARRFNTGAGQADAMRARIEVILINFAQLSKALKGAMPSGAACSSWRTRASAPR